MLKPHTRIQPLKFFILFVLIALGLQGTGCLSFPPSRSYDADVKNYEAFQGVDTTGVAPKTLTVKANERWQSSDVRLTKNTQVKVVAMGKWSPWPAMNVWAGPEGNPSSAKEVPWVTGSALMAKIGEKGKPFEIGPSQEFRATEEGLLYLAMNDPFGFLSDNTGTIQVTIYARDKDSVPATPLAAITPTKRTIPGNRTALVIGNSQYDVGALKNPTNDAQDMANTLRQLGFTVILQLNATQEQMEEAISHFGRQLYQGGVGLFYYAGHGVQVGGENYLIPTRARIESESDVRYKAVNAGQVLGKMGEARNGLNIVILDACRDNPFSRSFRSSARGLAIVNSAQAKGTLIAYATSPGKVANDGEERNGLYTKYLLQNMQVPGIPVEQVFKRVLQGVERETNGKQSPWTSSSFSGDFYFVPQ